MKKKKLLDSIDVKSPCNESWDEMFGNDEVRFCSHCAKNVHNLSAMTRQKAEELIKNSSGKLCVRYVKNPNGKIVTAPPTLTKITRRATIAASVLATSLTLSTITYSQGEPIVKKDNSTQTQKDKSKKDETKQGFATVSGTVMDANGAVVAGAYVTLRDTKTLNYYPTKTNSEGFYELKNIEANIYELTIESPGFKKAVHRNIEILKEAKLEKNVVLEVSEATMGVVAVAELPLVENEQPKLAVKIESRKIEDLPKPPDGFKTTLGLIIQTKTEKPKKPKKKKN